MLRALGILGTPETPDQCAPGGWLPLTPTSPSIRHSRNVALDRRVSDRKNPLARPETTMKEGTMAGPSKHPLSITPRRSKRLVDRVVLPPTPASLPSLSPRSGSSTKRARKTTSSSGTRKTRRKAVALVPLILVGPELEGPIEKINLIQERLRHDSWRMLVAIYLLNKTTGRAANPIREEIFRRWPTVHELAKASIPELAELLYPLGLFNQRANSLIRFSQQYIEFGWPNPAVLDVTVFYGAGRYASDSFRIFSPLMSGRGAPEQECTWLKKRERAIERRGAFVESEIGVEEVGDCMSEQEEEEEGEEEEWRKVRPTDKELRRYLIWRWGIEGITYDIDHGPRIHHTRDRERLKYLTKE